MNNRHSNLFYTVFMMLAIALVGFKLPSVPKSLPDIEPDEDTIPYVVPSPVIDAIAKSFYRWVIEKAQRENKLAAKDSKVLKQVTQVFEHLKEAAVRSKKYGKTAKKFEWELHVIEDDKIKNAFAWPAGKIAVYSCILGDAKNEAGLAAVLGHEMIHALARHAAHRINRNVIASLPIAGLATGTALNPDKLKPEVTIPIMAALGMGVAVGVDLPFSREHELEADYEGLFLAADAGYDPDETILFWSRLLNEERSEMEYTMTHPSTFNRFKILDSHMDEIHEVYRLAGEKQESMRRLQGIPTCRY